MTGALPLWPSTSDAELARSAAGGDRAAFAEIYDRYADRLYDFCVGLIGDRDAAADCVHDAFCVAATDLGDLREPDKLRPWLYSIVRNHAMRRLRGRYREEVSESVPDSASADVGPDTLAGQNELARLVADAAGGLSDRDRELLELSYRHGLDGPELAEALGVTLTNVNTMVFRLRQTVERCLGALLVARGTRSGRHACPELAGVLKDWDGDFTVLMRKRIGRHIDSCTTCTDEQRQRVNPVALLGGAPVFIPAPDWLRRRTLSDVRLTSLSSGVPDPTPAPAGNRRVGAQAGLLVGIPLVVLGFVWFAHRDTPVEPRVTIGTDSTPLTTGAVSRAPVVAPPVLAPRSAAPTIASVPTGRASTAPAVSAPSVATSAAPSPAPSPAGPTTTPKPAVTSAPSAPAPPPAPPAPAPPVPAPAPAPAPPLPPNPFPAPPPPNPGPPPQANPPAGTADNPNVTPPWTQNDPGFFPPWPQPPTGSNPGGGTAPGVQGGSPQNPVTPPWPGTPSNPKVTTGVCAPNTIGCAPTTG